MFETLKKLLGRDETIYEIERCAAAPIYVIGPVVEDIDRQLDISGCIEDTLHRMLEAGCDEKLVYEALHASLDYDTFGCDSDSDYSIDLGYVIYDFYPMHVIDTGNHYKRPVHEYTVHFWDKVLCQHLEIPDDAADEEILTAVSDILGINTEEFICEDVRNDGSMLSVQHVLDGNIMFVLMQNNSKASCKQGAA